MHWRADTFPGRLVFCLYLCSRSLERWWGRLSQTQAVAMMEPDVGRWDVSDAVGEACYLLTNKVLTLPKIEGNTHAVLFIHGKLLADHADTSLQLHL